MCNRLFHFAFVLFAAGLVAATGCSDGRPARVPVSGQVLIDGEPLTHGFVQVVPASGRPAAGKLGPDGRFSLTTYDKDDGVVPGKHPVKIVASEYISETETLWHAPQKYGRVETSDLTVTIDEPTDALVINLTWDGDKPFRTRNGERVNN